MTPATPPLQPVTQADRDLWKWLLNAPFATCSRIDNLPDDCEELQKIARHRLATQSPSPATGDREAIEAALIAQAFHCESEGGEPFLAIGVHQAATIILATQSPATPTEELREALERIAAAFVNARGQRYSDYGEVTGDNFQMMTMHPDPEALASDLNRLPEIIQILIAQSPISAEIERLRSALGRMVYETTSLSPCEPNGDHWCKISSEALAIARDTLTTGGKHAGS